MSMFVFPVVPCGVALFFLCCLFRSRVTPSVVPSVLFVVPCCSVFRPVAGDPFLISGSSRHDPSGVCSFRVLVRCQVSGAYTLVAKRRLSFI